ncbi:MAG: hypothetical protein J0I28_00870 [Caulobacterales bacterium]|nr:hypothetical protein [Caulobacterales bacterium]
MVEDEHDIIQFGGKGVSEAIGAILSGLGYSVGELDYQGERGWEFSAGAEGQQIWLLLSDLGDYLMLQVEDPSFMGLRPKYRQFREHFLSGLTDALNRDGRFHDLLWFAAVGDPFGFPDPAGEGGRRPAPQAWRWS